MPVNRIYYNILFFVNVIYRNSSGLKFFLSFMRTIQIHLWKYEGIWTENLSVKKNAESASGFLNRYECRGMRNH